MSNMLSHNVHVLGSVATSSLTAWRGCLVVKNVPQPEKPIVLYDMEGCPYCRRVREALTALNLDVEIRPCPKGGSVFRAQAEALGGRQQFPLLADQNTGTVMYESEEISWSGLAAGPGLCSLGNQRHAGAEGQPGQAAGAAVAPLEFRGEPVFTFGA